MGSEAQAHPGDISRLSIKKIRHDDLTLSFLVSICEDICSLQSLWEEAEDIVLHDLHLFSIQTPCYPQA